MVRNRGKRMRPVQGKSESWAPAASSLQRGTQTDVYKDRVIVRKREKTLREKILKNREKIMRPVQGETGFWAPAVNSLHREEHRQVDIRTELLIERENKLWEK